ncbi:MULTISPECIES: hypothetical protein [Streptomyces]|nr:hypothetical protein [Streptomyces sp. yr375]SES31734.1 hypothetical protein SAMN04487983_104249 [Streptomyces sp. yr375]
MGLPQLPPSHGEALHSHSIRNLLLSEARGKAQLLPHTRRRQDVIE